ncbi:hypothetical protein GE21DRAFT_1222867, partial [Neurospora crassa]
IYINNIIITLNLVDDYLKYLNIIFLLFVSKNIILLPKKSYLSYPSVELFSFYINKFNISITKERIEAFRKFIFLNLLKAFK